MKDMPIGTREDGSPIFDNTASVSVVLVYDDDKVLIVKRANGHGKGQWALPGGFQMNGQTWQQCAADEVMEETAIKIDPSDVRLYDVVYGTTYGHNLFLCINDGRYEQTSVETDGECSEHKFVHVSESNNIDWAFTIHKEFLDNAVKDVIYTTR